MSAELRTLASQTEAHPFDVDAYLIARDQNPTFTMIEFGHGKYPVAHLQKNLTGDRSYLGVEAWIREPKIHDLPCPDSANPNFSFVDLALYSGMQHDSKRGSHTTEKYKQAYDPTTELGDSIADEIILSNVAGDPQISDRPLRTGKVLQEMARLLRASGTLIIRETRTPERARLDEATLAAQGLKAVHRETLAARTSAWPALEARFDGARNEYLLTPESFYLFIQPMRNSAHTAE